MTTVLKIFAFFRSPLLALILLLFILAACFVGTALMPPQIGSRVVFSSLWFNGLLILLVVNTAFCFFGRIHLRGWNLVSVGMIIFHLSFVSIFSGVIVNSLFCFKGSLRMTEGESISVGDPEAYDTAEWGRFFNHSWMRGTITFKKLHTRYKDGNENKGVANEIEINDGSKKVDGIIYPTKHLEMNGFKFFRNTDGFAPLYVLYEKQGKVLYGAYTPLQSLRKNDSKEVLYSTGSKSAPGPIDFPQGQGVPPLFKIQLIYNMPEKVDGSKRFTFKAYPAGQGADAKHDGEVFNGSGAMGEKVPLGEYDIVMEELRYWASMDVLYNPGNPIVFVSLWVGLGGITLTNIGRLLQRRKRKFAEAL